VVELFLSKLTARSVIKNGKPYEVFGIARDVTDRKRANEAIKHSEEKYRMIFENAPLGIMTADISGNIIELNPVLLTMLGSKSVQETKNINVLSFLLWSCPGWSRSL